MATQLDPWDVWNDPRGPWVFISHVHTQRHLAGDLKRELSRYGIEGFVAHDDIEPAREWEDHIVAALQSCQALVALLSADAHESRWVDQEVGWALGRGLLVVSVSLDIAPYGFIGRYQAIPGAGRSPEDIADQLFEVLLGDARTAPSATEGMVTAFVESASFEDARWTFDRLNRIPALSTVQLDRIEDAYASNDQLSYAFYVQNRIEEFLRRHWAAHGIEDYQMTGSEENQEDGVE